MRATSLPWPPGFERIPDEPWARAPVDPSAQAYDGLQRHGWYANLDPTVRRVAGWLEEGGLALDYSGGTGILEQRLLAGHPGTQAGIVNVDASPKFLRVAVERLGHDPRCAFRLLGLRRGEGRLATLAEAVPELATRGLDVVACANAVHLYPDPPAVMQGWAQALRPGGRLHVQSGNVPRPGAGARTIDATVAAAEEAARALALEDARYAPYRAALADPRRMEGYAALRRRFFPPPRPLAQYLAWLEAAGFAVDAVRHEPVEVRLDEWTEFLAIYHEGILPWVGGAERVDGAAPSAQAVEDRVALLRQALRQAIGSERFTAEWTYVDATRAG
jgi:SAM-dependent methyltransferase